MIWVPPWYGLRYTASLIVRSIEGVAGRFAVVARGGVRTRLGADDGLASAVEGEGWLSGIVWMMPGLDLFATVLASLLLGVSGEEGTCRWWGEDLGDNLVALGDP